ncbi:MAG: GNAT family N-acetyltransferase [Candidatus Paracaedibacteraceae bacterium]|nr:GNAT family N-acetyltransferase [Candidatus Paracaedibacteraceae bacterium]
MDLGFDQNCLNQCVAERMNYALSAEAVQSEDALLVRSIKELPLKIDEHCSLQLFTPTDASELFNLVEENRHYLRKWLPWLDNTKSIKDIENFISISNKNLSENKSVVLSIKYNNDIVGVISFHTIDWRLKETAIGYWLAENYQGKGIITNACRQLLAFCFSKLKLKRVNISCAKENKKSISVVERVGFKYLKEVENYQWLYDYYVDHVFFSMENPTTS